MAAWPSVCSKASEGRRGIKLDGFMRAICQRYQGCNIVYGSHPTWLSRCVSIRYSGELSETSRRDCCYRREHARCLLFHGIHVHHSITDPRHDPKLLSDMYKQTDSRAKSPGTDNDISKPDPPLKPLTHHETITSPEDPAHTSPEELFGLVELTLNLDQVALHPQQITIIHTLLVLHPPDHDLDCILG